jgi:PleD family two-component response regulator
MIVSDGNSKYFDLPTLFKQGVLSIRKIAADEPTLSTDEYFSRLSTFVNLVPDVKRAIANFSRLDGEKEDYRHIESMLKLLEKLGCDKFTITFHSILDAYGQRGNWRFAAAYAKSITEAFSEFCSQIMAAQMTKKAVDPSGKDDLISSGALYLKDYIQELDNEEAERKLTILAIDDSPVILNAVSSVLSADYRVFTLPKPMELENILQKLTPELFLLDYQMPERNGFELIPIIRNMAEHKDTPIVFLTSEGTMDNLTTAIALGACDFVVKPFDPIILHNKIAKHIVRKKLF